VNKEDLVPLESDETLLSIYMNQLSNRFPFVIIPPGTTAVHLEATRPLLMKVIRMVASVRHLRSMRGQSRAVIQHKVSKKKVSAASDTLQGPEIQNERRAKDLSWGLVHELKVSPTPPQRPSYVATLIL
jgi:hypothetical protein